MCSTFQLRHGFITVASRVPDAHLACCTGASSALCCAGCSSNGARATGPRPLQTVSTSADSCAPASTSCRVPRPCSW